MSYKDMEQRIKELDSKERGPNVEDESFTTRGPEDPNSSLEVGTGWLMHTVRVKAAGETASND